MGQKRRSSVCGLHAARGCLPVFRGLAVTVLGTGVRVVSADEAQNAGQLVDKARFTFNDFVVNKVMQPFRALLKQARNVRLSRRSS
jgi:hypothetical protein